MKTDDKNGEQRMDKGGCGIAEAGLELMIRVGKWYNKD